MSDQRDVAMERPVDARDRIIRELLDDLRDAKRAPSKLNAHDMGALLERAHYWVNLLHLDLIGWETEWGEW